MKLPSIMAVTGMLERGNSTRISAGVSGLASDFGKTVIEPLVSTIAYSTSAGLKYPLPRRASSKSSMFMFSSFMMSGSMLPRSMTITGLPLSTLRNRTLLTASLVMMMCTRNSVNTEIMPYTMGILGSPMGMQASSLATSVMANSKGCNSPSCRLPISRIATSRKK